jgi:DNA repair protein RadD
MYNMYDGLFETAPEPKPLRDYQAASIDRLRASLASGHRRPVLMAPTGAGKTVIASAIIRMARGKGKRIAFCVPKLSLVDQTVEAFWSEGICDIGVMQADHRMTDHSKPVQICSLQTVESRGFPECDLAIIDEAHEMRKIVGSWMEAKPGMPVIGLTATPWAQGMGKRYDDLVIVSTTKELIDQGYLCDFRVFAPSHPDLSKVKIVAGDYHEGQLSEVMRNGELVGDVVDTWLKLGEERPTIIFAVDRAHARALQDQFADAGVPCGYQDMDTTPGERAIIRDQFREGRLKLVANVATLTTGVDWDVRCIILARPTKSEMLFVQMIGRGLRTAEGKADCRVIDHSDTHLRLGFVTDIHHDTLDDGTRVAAEKRARDKKPSLPKECSKCHFLKPPRVHACPHCGFAPERQSDVRHEQGELAEMKPKINGKRVSDQTIMLRDKAIPLDVFMGCLKRYAREKNYKPGWAANKYRDAMGHWPLAHKHAAECDVLPEVRLWIVAGQIRWAKSRRNPRNSAHVENS